MTGHDPVSSLLPNDMRSLAFLVLVLAAMTGACGDPFALQPAGIVNAVDTVEMYAVNGTPLDRPSGYSIGERDPGSRLVRLGLEARSFDFLYRIDATTGPEFAPFSVVSPAPAGQSTAGRSGFLATTAGFDAIKEAEQVGFVIDKPVQLVEGKVILARSAISATCFIQIPYYSKIEVLSFDPVARSVKFRILSNVNCGYRGLEPGLPTR